MFRTSLAIVLLFSSVTALPGGLRAELPRSGQRSCLDATGEQIACSGQGQDGALQAGAVWPVPRFSNNGDGTLTDHLTGLMWLRDGGCLGEVTWQAAMNAAGEMSASPRKQACLAETAAYADWQLPEARQLESLFHAGERDVRDWLHREGFKEIKQGAYWSSSPSPNPYMAWGVDLSSGTTSKIAKVEYRHALLVREAKEGVAELVGEAMPTGRFTDNGDGTISDTLSGLMWLKDAACLGEHAWNEALTAVERLNRHDASLSCTGYRATHTDWSLPNRTELRSIVNHGRDLPALADTLPAVGIKPLYWSSTTALSQPKSAFDLHMGWGDTAPSDKEEKRFAWAVRPMNGRTKRPLIDDAAGKRQIAIEQYIPRPVGDYKPISWPVKRFTNHGDGTISDNLTGLMWLRDGNCFGRLNRELALTRIGVLNRNPARLACQEYTAAYDNWQLPEKDALLALPPPSDEEAAAWLNGQGATNLQARDYWVLEENGLNLYHAWAVNLREGGERNYPKSFALYVWPVRNQDDTWPVNPQPELRANGTAGSIHLHQGEELLLSAAIDNRRGKAPADYAIHYQAPDGSKRWLTREGYWSTERHLLYQGNLFQLDDYPFFLVDTHHLATGTYTFVFDIIAHHGEESSLQQSSTLHVNLDEAEKAPASPLP